jgi:fused signal recognition particle receptor
VAFDGMAAANARKSGTVLIDTAGRLHTKVNLLEELKKIERITIQQASGRYLYKILVIDSTTGQNALNQARVFYEALQINGLILTKLDGTAKGGIAVAIAHQLHIPIYFAGIGERPADLEPFEAASFARALFDS